MAGKASVALFLAVSLVVFAMARPATASYGKCPRDALKLGACVNLLGLIKANVAAPPSHPCCPLLEGLVDLQAAACLCAVINGNVLGSNLHLPVDLSLVLNHCGKRLPTGFQCA